MRRITAEQVHALKVGELGLDPNEVDLLSVEAIAGALRRAARFRCPCSGATLVRSVVSPLRGLVADLPSVQGVVEETLERLVGLGDLLEQRDVAADDPGNAASLIYCAPPAFVERQSGSAILLGIAADGPTTLPPDLERRVEYAGYVRRLKSRPGEDLRAELAALGLVSVSPENWLRLPATETSGQVRARYDRLLGAALPSRDVPGLTILDPDRPVRYYRGRWLDPSKQTGRFVGRRRQAYGADLWCYVELRDGSPERLVDLPPPGSRWRGCDEAWQLQMAIDKDRGQPQVFRLRSEPGDSVMMEFFSPLPLWARRRLDAVGAMSPGSGCLFAYRLKTMEAREESQFAREVLWLEQLPEHA